MLSSFEKLFVGLYLIVGELVFVVGCWVFSLSKCV